MYQLLVSQSAIQRQGKIIQLMQQHLAWLQRQVESSVHGSEGLVLHWAATKPVMVILLAGQHKAWIVMEALWQVKAFQASGRGSG